MRWAILLRRFGVVSENRDVVWCGGDGDGDARLGLDDRRRRTKSSRDRYAGTIRHVFPDSCRIDFVLHVCFVS